MSFEHLLDKRGTAHLPTIGVFTPDGLPQHPAVSISGTYERNIPGFEGTPVLYAATLSFSQSAIKERISLRLIPDPRADAAFEPGYRSSSTSLRPDRPGDHPISRTTDLIHMPMRQSYRDRPFFVSEFKDHGKETMRDLLLMLGHLVPTDTLRIKRYLGDRSFSSVITVRQMLDEYHFNAQEMKGRFDLWVRQKKIMVPQEIGWTDQEPEGRTRQNDEALDVLYDDPSTNLWPYSCTPAEYYNRRRIVPQRKKTRGKKRR